MTAPLGVLGIPSGLFHMIIQGNVLDGLKRLPDDSIDTVMTSPPYWGLRDYKLPPTVWDADTNCGHEWNSIIKPAGGGFDPDSKVGNNATVKREPTQSDFCSKCSAWKGQLGLEPDFRLYVKHILQRQMKAASGSPKALVLDVRTVALEEIKWAMGGDEPE